MPEQVPQEEKLLELPAPIREAIERFQTAYAWTEQEGTVIRRILDLQEGQESYGFSAGRAKQMRALEAKLPSTCERIRRGLKAAFNPSDEAA